MIRILIVAPSSLARAGLDAVLRNEPSLDVVSSIPSLAGLSASVRTYKPDAVLVLLDSPVEEPPEELFDLTAGPEPPAIILLATAPSAAWTGEAIRSGVKAVLPAELAGSELAAAIHAAVSGLVVLHPQDVEILISAQPHAEPTVSGARSQSLSSREIEVLRMLAEGQSNKAIAWKLGISEHTVKFHVASIMSKLHAGSRTEAVTIGLRRGLILI